MDKRNDRRQPNSSASERSSERSLLKTGAVGTMDELHEFVGQMRGKSPQQVLGLVAASGLMHGIIWSTIATVIVLLTFTILPYLLSEPEPAKNAAVAKDTPAAESVEKADASGQKAVADVEDASMAGGKKEAAIKAMTEELEETKGDTADDVPDIDKLLELE